SAVSLSDDTFPAITTALCSGPYIAFTKGAPASVLNFSTSILENGSIRPLDPLRKQTISQSSDALAQQGFRVLALGFRTLGEPFVDLTEETVEQNLTFAGFIGLIDP